MLFETIQQVAALGVPDTNGLVIRPARERLAVRRPGHTPDGAGVPFEATQVIAADCVPRRTQQLLDAAATMVPSGDHATE